jgi:hypothetical protein
MTNTNTTTSALPEAHAEWKRAHALLESMYVWAFNCEAQADVCIEVGREHCVPDWLMARVHGRHNWYLVPNVSTLDTETDRDRGETETETLRRRDRG